VTMSYRVLALVAVASCGGDGESATPLITADYADSFVEVRDCRRSIDHDLQFVRIHAAPDALAPYRDREAAFPVGAVVVKEQFVDNDDDCSGEVQLYTVMRKLDAGADPDLLDWEWQELDADFDVVSDAEPLRCARCHETCEPPEGYLGTCAAP
jgi:hypothetical protein